MTPIKNTFQIPASAARLVEYDSEEQLRAIIPSLQGKRFMHVGAGSNLLFTKDFDGTILHSLISTIEVLPEPRSTATHCLMRVGAGMEWDKFVERTVCLGLSGVENLSLIPGEVGASAVQNIGAYGVEAKDVIDSVECIDLRTGEKRIFSNAECRYAYRSSIFKHELRGQYAVTHVVYRLSRNFVPHLDYGNLRSVLESETPTPLDVRRAIISIRQSKLPDPEVLGNAGSFFMNPVVSQEKFEELQAKHPEMPHYDAPQGVKIPAGWLIEQCGWKGRALGPAAVHDRQALVLVNRGGATGQDVLRLCEAVQKSVADIFGIELHAEVNII